MIQRAVSVVVAGLSMLVLPVAVAQPAYASHYSATDCIGIFVNYESSGSSRYVIGFESMNVCDPFTGYFITQGEPSRESFGPARQVVAVNRTVPIGTQFCGTIYQRLTDRELVDRGSTCTRVV